jgi:uncharacterized protein (DUF2141 family)
MPPAMREVTRRTLRIGSLAALCGLTGSAAQAAPMAMATIDVEVTGLKSDAGKVVILVYTSAKGFPTDPKRAKRAFFTKPSGKKASRTLADLPPGTYALSIYHDANNNGELDTNWIGMPKEGLGASNNAKGRMGPPKFAAAAFVVGPGETANQKIRLTYL